MDEAAMQNMLYGLETARYQQELGQANTEPVGDGKVGFCKAISDLAEIEALLS